MASSSEEKMSPDLERQKRNFQAVRYELCFIIVCSSLAHGFYFLFLFFLFILYDRCYYLAVAHTRGNRFKEAFVLFERASG